MISRIAKINNDFLKYTLYRIYSLKSQLIIMILCGILSFPLITFALSLNLNAEEAQSYTDGTGSFLIISIFLCVVAASVFMLLTYTAGVNCYDYYNRRERVDLSWSLPIKSRDRFWGDFASGIVPLALTYIISALVGLLIIKVGFPEETFHDGLPNIMGMITASMFAGLLTIISVYIIAIFCAAICGRVYETVVYPALIFVIIPAVIALFGNMIFNNVWQISIFEQLETILAGTSPGGFLIIFFSKLSNHWNWYYTGQTLSENLTFLNPAIIIPFILINAGFLTGAYYLAKRRGAEKTGLSFVFKGALEIILALIIFCITALFFMINANSYSGFGTGFVFGLVMCTAIAFLVLDVSAKRGFKKMGSAGIKYACMLAGSIVISNLLLAADGFGIGRYVPSMDDIESVHIDVQFLDSHQFGNFRSGWFHGFGGDMELVEFTDKAAVELIRQLHIESNENPHNYNTDYYFAPVPSGAPSWQSDMFRRQQPVTYILKNGDTVTRNIRMSFMQIERLLPLIVSDDYKITQINSIDNWLASKEIVEAEAVFASLTGERASSEGADVMRLYEAFKIDYLAETFDQRFRSAGRIAGMLYLSFDEMAQIFPNDMRLYRQDTTGLNVYVLPHYTNLIAELERQGFDLSGEFGENLKLWNIAIIKADYIGASAETSTFGWWGAQNIDMWYEDEKIAELTNILINVMQPVHIVSGEGYTLSFQFGRFGGHFVIPPAYNTVAEELFSLAQSIEAAHRTEQHENDYYYYYD